MRTLREMDECSRHGYRTFCDSFQRFGLGQSTLPSLLITIVLTGLICARSASGVSASALPSKCVSSCRPGQLPPYTKSAGVDGAAFDATVLALLSGRSAVQTLASVLMSAPSFARMPAPMRGMHPAVGPRAPPAGCAWASACGCAVAAGVTCAIVGMANMLDG